MSIMDMFSNVFGGSNSSPVPQSATAGAGQPGNIPPNTPPNGEQSVGTAPNGTIPQGTADLNKEPLAEFSELWTPEKPDPNNPAPQKSGVFGNVDPKKFMEAAGKIDFTKVVTPENMQAIASGGEGAVKAFAEAMNSVARSVYAQSSFASTKLIEAALAKSKEGLLAELPTHIKSTQVTDSLRQDNPVFANPAVAPIMEALKAQLTVKYPNASASEITGMAKQYVEQLGQAVIPKPADSGSKVKSKETDWSSFLG